MKQIKPFRNLNEFSDATPEMATRWIATGQKALDAADVDKEDEPLEQQIRDTITALLHLANSKGIDAEKCGQYAIRTFLDETEKA